MVVYIDYENIRRTALDEYNHSGPGLVCPLLLAELIAARRQNPTNIHQIRVYRGQPSGRHESRRAAEAAEAVQRWKARDSCVNVITRPITYRNGQLPGQEKGIDVHIAVDMVVAATTDDIDIDVAVLCSNDLDLAPVREVYAARNRKIEFATWGRHVSAAGIPIGQPPRKFWTHNLTEADYRHCLEP